MSWIGGWMDPDEFLKTFENYTDSMLPPAEIVNGNIRKGHLSFSILALLGEACFALVFINLIRFRDRAAD